MNKVEPAGLRAELRAELRDREIADAIGYACDGQDQSEEELLGARSALAGPALTSDRGMRLYYAQIDTMALENVDTAEGIWSTGPDGIVRGLNGEILFDLNDEASAFEHEVVMLTALRDPARLARLAARWEADPDRRGTWAAFVRRVVLPIQKLS